MSNELPDWLRSTACAFLFWIIFLLALEPGNVLHARSMGRTLANSMTRPCASAVAALLGCSTAPALMALGRRFPLCRRARLAKLRDPCGRRRHAVRRADPDLLRARGVDPAGASRSLAGRCPQSARSQLAAADVRTVRIRRARACDEGAIFTDGSADSPCGQDSRHQNTRTPWLRRHCQHRVDRKPGKLSGAACRRPFSSHPRDAREISQADSTRTGSSACTGA